MICVVYAKSVSFTQGELYCLFHRDINKGMQRRIFRWIYETITECCRAAITQLALSYENFDQDSVRSENWKENFIARFIQNSRLSFDYLDMISDQNNGQISTDELNYIQYSLTNTELDFSSYVDGFINRNDSASPLNYGWISEYDYEYINSRVIITADFEAGYDGTDSMQEREITVKLVKNPYSCFDGYSVVAISSETAASRNNSD